MLTNLLKIIQLNWIILRMQQADPEREEKPQKQLNTYVKYSALGFQMVAVIGVFAFIGYKIDRSYAHTTAWVTALMSLLGVLMSMYLVIRSLKN